MGTAPSEVKDVASRMHDQSSRIEAEICCESIWSETQCGLVCFFFFNEIFLKASYILIHYR